MTTAPHKHLIAWLACLALLTPLCALAQPGEIRILIDVSGSMKRNDPENLRIPALKLITGLLPKGTRAGVWTFGKYVNMLVPVDTVDDAWRARAIAAAEKISSHGLYTNMEETLADASWGWKETTEETRRSIILLTDGYVDISPDPDKNRASRDRILNALLPRLQQTGVSIHTIALSGDADAALLRQLATATRGSYEQALSAEQLERLFFHMFERTANPDTLPLEDNTILVDETIEELTLLIFRKEGAPETRLTTPHGITFAHDKLPPNVRWHREKRYDLITIDQPMTGEWQVAADMDPDNRVMVVTNLQAVTTRLPENIALGDEHTFYIRLLDHGKVIEKKEFLYFVRVDVTQESDSGERWDWMLLDNGRRGDARPGDGTYTLHLDRSLATGTHRLTVEIDGTTFKRVHHQTFNVYDSPVLAVIENGAENQEEIPVLSVIPRAGMIVPDTMEIRATLSDGDGMEQILAVPRVNHNEWRLPLGDYPADRRYRIDLSIQGERPSGRPIDDTTGPLYFGAPPAVTEAEEPVAETLQQATETNPVDADDETTASEDAPPNWLWVGFQVLLINALVIGGLIFAYRKWFPSMQVPHGWEAQLQE
ncbi:MAG TPA: VWA domain-containing protein [Gammaproteobacteria bacterium]|nr:VWA domain-containing protein [Gammaproteobacteria bacterium]